MKKILILEDDLNLAQTLKIALENKQVNVRAVNTLQDFYQQIENHHFDLCVMDRLINKEDALLAGEYAKDILPKVKILFLSKKGEIKDRIQGLETAGDDYLAKPFSLAELRLRVRNLLAMQRVTDQEGRRLLIGELVFYPNQGVIETPDYKTQLRRRETEVLNCLAQASGAVISRHQLTRTLWPANYEPNASTVDVYIRRLRQKLGEYSFMLQTHRGFGYCLTAVRRKT